MAGEKKINVKALTLTASLLWGGSVLFVGICNYVWPWYGQNFLQMIDSVYPGYQAAPSLRQVLIGTCYALFDGALGGFLAAVLYNFFSGVKK